MQSGCSWDFAKYSHVRSHHVLWHCQKVVLPQREELPEVTWCRNEAVTAGWLTLTASTYPGAMKLLLLNVHVSWGVWWVSFL